MANCIAITKLNDNPTSTQERPELASLEDRAISISLSNSHFIRMKTVISGSIANGDFSTYSLIALVAVLLITLRVFFWAEMLKKISTKRASKKIDVPLRSPEEKFTIFERIVENRLNIRIDESTLNADILSDLRISFPEVSEFYNDISDFLEPDDQAGFEECSSLKQMLDHLEITNVLRRIYP